MPFVVPALASAQGAPAMTYGVKAGFNVSSIKVSFEDVSVTSDGRAGMVIGGWVARDFSPRGGIQVEGLLEQKGGEFDISDDIGFDDDSSFRLTYLTFPVLGRVNFPAGMSTVRLLAGPTFGFHVNESIKVGDVELDGDEVDLETFEAGFALGGQVEIRRFVVDVRYIWGLTSINASDDEDEPSVKNNAFQLTFGWSF
jgi:hypothetical protein